MTSKQNMIEQTTRARDTQQPQNDVETTSQLATRLANEAAEAVTRNNDGADDVWMMRDDQNAWHRVDVAAWRGIESINATLVRPKAAVVTQLMNDGASCNVVRALNVLDLDARRVARERGVSLDTALEQCVSALSLLLAPGVHELAPRIVALDRVGARMRIVVAESDASLCDNGRLLAHTLDDGRSGPRACDERLESAARRRWRYFLDTSLGLPSDASETLFVAADWHACAVGAIDAAFATDASLLIASSSSDKPCRAVAHLLCREQERNNAWADEQEEGEEEQEDDAPRKRRRRRSREESNTDEQLGMKLFADSDDSIDESSADSGSYESYDEEEDEIDQEKQEEQKQHRFEHASFKRLLDVRTFDAAQQRNRGGGDGKHAATLMQLLTVAALAQVVGSTDRVCVCREPPSAVSATADAHDVLEEHDDGLFDDVGSTTNAVEEQQPSISFFDVDTERRFVEVLLHCQVLDTDDNQPEEGAARGKRRRGRGGGRSNEIGDSPLAQLLALLLHNVLRYDSVAGAWYGIDSSTGFVWMKEAGDGLPLRAINEVATPRLFALIDSLEQRYGDAVDAALAAVADDYVAPAPVPARALDSLSEAQIDRLVVMLRTTARHKLMSNGGRRAVIRELRRLPPISDADFGAKLDTNMDIIALPNGVFDFVRGEFRAGTPDDRVGRTCAAPFLHAARHWRTRADYEAHDDGFRATMHAFREAYPDEADLEYIIALLACCLRGGCDEKLYVLDGRGRNFKSLLIAFAAHVLLGRYAVAVEPTLFTGERPSSASASPDMLSLRGARLVHSSEPDKRRPLNINFLKRLTGGDGMVGRGLYSNDFVPIQVCGRFWISCNGLPDAPTSSTERVAVQSRLRILLSRTTFYAPGDPEYDESDPTHRIKVARDVLMRSFEDGAPAFITYLLTVVWPQCAARLAAGATDPMPLHEGVAFNAKEHVDKGESDVVREWAESVLARNGVTGESQLVHLTARMVPLCRGVPRASLKALYAAFRRYHDQQRAMAVRSHGHVEELPTRSKFDERLCVALGDGASTVKKRSATCLAAYVWRPLITQAAHLAKLEAAIAAECARVNARCDNADGSDTNMDFDN